jgi:hypothetical protein
VLSFVGIGSAIGQTLEIPIMVRSLADSLARLSEDDLPVPINPGFLALLDVDARERHDKGRVVDRYDCSWWTGRRPQDLSTVECLTEETLMRCLEFHREQLGEGQDIATPAHPTRLAMPPAPALLGAGQTTNCRTCVEYRGLVSEMFKNLQEIHKYSTAMTTASENQWKIDMRSASTFHLLHQAVIAKETAHPAPVPVPVHASTKTRASAVRLQAQKELNKYNALPPASHKWTWGEVLTEGDVLALRRTGTRPGRAPHSGYDISLKDGTEPYNSSPLLTHPSASAVFDDLPPEISTELPTNIHPLPDYFTDYRQLKYDPLSEIARHIPVTPVIKLGDETVSVDTLADLWTSDSGGASPAGPVPVTQMDLADQWPNPSDDEDNGTQINSHHRFLLMNG